MNHITTYLYDNKVSVQILDLTLAAATRNRVVYSRPVKIYKGIDNPIVLEIKNQDQKPIDLTGMSIIVHIQDPDAVNAIATISAGVTNAAAGRATFTVPAATVNGLTQRFYKILVKTINTEQSRPAYIDQNYGIALDLEVLPGYQV